MAPEKVQMQLLGFRPPLQMGGGADVQFRIPTCSQAALVQIQHATQVGVPPATNQQHRLPHQGVRWVMPDPGVGLGWGLPQPSTGHAVRVNSAQKRQAVAAVAVVLQAAADVLPGLLVTFALALQCRQLQAPSQPEVPPVGSAFAAPVVTFIQTRHRGSKTIGERAARLGKQLREALIREAVNTNAAVAFRQAANPGQGGIGVGRFLTESVEPASGLTLTAHVLHHHHKPLFSPPARVGIGDGGGDGAPVGLTHQ